MTQASELVEVAGGVFAYVQAPGGWCVSNAGLLADDDGEGVVVIDTAATEARARRLREHVDELGAGPRRVVVNTHAHGDHTFGNAMFGPSATIIAHERARAEMAATGLALTKLWPDVGWGDIELAFPTVTVAERCTVRLGGRTAELRHFGPSHTDGDLVVWLPAERVLFAGDVLMSGVTPFLLFGSVLGTLRTIEELRALRPRTVVCGHGPVGGPEVLDECARYVRAVLAIAEESRSAGLSPLEAARSADLGAFAELVDPERIVGNLHRAYAELGGGRLGEPLDAVAIFDEMVEYNGGRLPACLA